MAIQILVPKRYAAKDMAKSSEAPVGPRGSLRGTHVGDLAGAAKLIILCDLCTAKFDWKKNKYVSYPDSERPQPVWGQCDACRESGLSRSFIPEALDEKVTYRRRIGGRWGTSFNR